MQLPENVKQIRARYVARFPIPQGQPGPEIEDSVRRWAIGLAEQVAFELPGQGWGTKRADPNRPISKDGLARLVDGRLWIWDMVTGAGTGNGQLVDNPEATDITGQVFVEVTPGNHLGVVPPVVQQATPATSFDLSPLVAQLAEMNARLEKLEQGQQATTENFASLGGRFNDDIERQRAFGTLFDAVTQELKQQIAARRKGSVRVYGRTIGDIEI